MGFPVENHPPSFPFWGSFREENAGEIETCGEIWVKIEDPKRMVCHGVPSDTSEIVSMQHLYFNMSGSTQKMVSKFNSLVTKMEG
jgi:hypothetical protein